MWEQRKHCTHAKFIRATWLEPAEAECEADRDEWQKDVECEHFHEIGDEEW